MKLYITEAGYPEIGQHWKSEEQAAKWYGEHGYPESDVRTDLLDMGYDDGEDERFIQAVMGLTPEYYKSNKPKPEKPKTFRDVINLSKEKQIEEISVTFDHDFDVEKYGGDFDGLELNNYQVAEINNGNVEMLLDIPEELLMDAKVTSYTNRMCFLSPTEKLRKIIVKMINSKVSRSVKKARKLLADYLRKNGIDPTDPRIADDVVSFNARAYYEIINKLKPDELEARYACLIPICKKIIKKSKNKNESINYKKKKYVKEDLYQDAQKAVYDFFMKKQWDLNIPEVANYADAVAEQLELDPEFADGTYTMRDWYKDTYWNYPEEIEWLDSTAY